MTDSVNFSTDVGGDGTTITNDRNATTGIKGGGHVSRFVKCLSQMVAVAVFVKTKAVEVSNNAAAALIYKNAAAASAALLDGVIVDVTSKMENDFSNAAAVLDVAHGGTGVDNLGGLKTALVLDAVDNVADMDKPVSTAQALADAAVLSSAQGYADGLVVGLVDDRGSYDASGNVFPSSGGSGVAGAILKGDLWFVSVAGTLGGTPCQIGTSVRALADSPGQTSGNWSIISTTLGFTPENNANKSTSMDDIASTTKFPVWSILVSWANSVYQAKNSKLTDIAALAATAGSVIVGNGTTWVLQALGNAASKNVGTGSADVAAGNKGLPDVGANGQVLTVVSGVWQSAEAAAAAGGGGGSIQQFITKFYYNYSSTTRLLYGGQNLILNTISGASAGYGVINLPVGVYYAEICIATEGAGRAGPASYGNVLQRQSGGSVNLDTLLTTYSDASSASSIATNYYWNEQVITVTGSAAALCLDQPGINMIGGSNYTASTTARALIKIVKIG